MQMQRLALLAVAAVVVVPQLAHAQQPTRRRQAPIEIRGEVPTPQVVTVRPRAVPSYSRQVLVPRFYDHDFWPDIQAGYQLIPERQITGQVPADSLAADSAALAPSPAPTAPAAGTKVTPGTTPPAATPAPAPDGKSPPSPAPGSSPAGTASAPRKQ